MRNKEFKALKTSFSSAVKTADSLAAAKASGLLRLAAKIASEQLRLEASENARYHRSCARVLTPSHQAWCEELRSMNAWKSWS